MPAIKRSDLNYSDYSWRAATGDDPSKTKEDADRFSRNEGYEVLDLLNSLKGPNHSDLLIHTRQVCEWMIHEKLPAGVQGRSKVISWLVANYPFFAPSYPRKP